MRLVKIDIDGYERKYIFEQALRKGVLKNAIVFTIDNDSIVKHISLNNISLGIARWDEQGYVGSYRWESEDELKRMSYLAKHFSISFLADDAIDIEFADSIRKEIFTDLHDPYLRKIINEFCTTDKEDAIIFNTDRYSVEALKKKTKKKAKKKIAKKAILFWSLGIVSALAVLFAVFLIVKNVFIDPEEDLETLQGKINAGVLILPTDFLSSEVPSAYINRKRNLKALLTYDVLPVLGNFKKRLFKALKSKNKKIQLTSVVKMPLDLGMKKDEILDGWIYLEKQEQINNFISHYSSKYNPDKGELASFYSDFYYYNIMPLVYNFSANKSYKFIDSLVENLHINYFLDTFLSELNKNKNSNYATEILFSILQLLQDQQQIIELLLMDWKEDLIPARIKKYPRYFILDNILTRYKEKLNKKKIKNTKQGVHYFYKLQMRILKWMHKKIPGSYRKGDIQFEIARLLWRTGNQNKKKNLMKKALGIWKKLGKVSGGLTKGRKIVIKKMLSFFKKNKKLNKKDQKKINYYLYELHAKKYNKKEARKTKLLWQD
jgi:hypothetical protein